MKVSEKIANTIDRFPVDYIFTCSDFHIEVSSKAAVVKALNRMATAGKISKLSKGRFYKPRKTRFGALKPTSYQIAKDFLEQNGEIIGYISGYSAFNSLGLTTQIPSTLHIGTNKYRRTVKRGMYTISFIVQPNKITKKNIELLRILDAIRFIKEIPATTPEEACSRLISIVSQLTEENKSALATLVLKYAPYVQALCGAILEMAGADENILKKIIKSLNPVTEYNIPISEEILPNKKKWRIK
jgi:predicted transcriptional regulator of viral defense system